MSVDISAKCLLSDLYIGGWWWPDILERCGNNPLCSVSKVLFNCKKMWTTWVINNHLLFLLQVLSWMNIGHSGRTVYIIFWVLQCFERNSINEKTYNCPFFPYSRETQRGDFVFYADRLVSECYSLIIMNMLGNEKLSLLSLTKV